MKRTSLAIALGVALALTGTVALAARNSSGTYSLNPSSPATPNTTISSSYFNTWRSDVATELTDSASRTGKGGFLAPVRGTDGSVGLPAFSFTNDTDTGFYRIGSGELALSLNGAKYFDWSAYMTTVSTPMYVTSTTTVAGWASFASSIEVAGSGSRFDSYVTFLGSTFVPTPVSSMEAATKGYVDATYSGTTTIVWGTGVSDYVGRTRLYKSQDGIVTLNVEANIDSGTPSLLMTLPAGYRPVSGCGTAGYNGTSLALAGFGVGTNGEVRIDAGTITTGQNYVFSISFKAQ